MSTENPYTPPSAEIANNAPGELASRWKRLFGSIIDGLLIGAVTLPLLFVTGYVDRISTGTQSIGEIILLGLAGIVVFFLINGYLLKNRGQTVGKMLMSTQIVSYENEGLLSLGKLIGLRYLPLWLVGQIPVIGQVVSIVNALFIFGSEKRCVHDHIAGTKVINFRTAPVPATAGIEFQ